MRRVTTGTALLAVGCVVGGCGNSTHTDTTASTRSEATTANIGSRTTGPPLARPMTSSQARAFARAVNLRPADVPGFKISSEQEHETAAEKRQGAAFMRCVGTVASKHGLFETGSREFERQTSSSTEFVRSYVEVADSTAFVAEELDAARSQHSRECLSSALDQLFSSSTQRAGGSAGPVSVELLTPAAPGTTGSFGWRISTTYSLHGINVPVRFDILGFGYKTTAVLLLDYGFPQPPPAPKERRLFSLLIRHAQSFRAK